ncbi:histidine phosphatase family protein [Aliiglaciecola litoralis]|uniref:2,3-diphosphoglycerate-dependent phosphoglycerate mutase GpmB n=1 Tax=Aliiglaciecola litoralis TaxID=582857 RepID=A0ABN1LDM4_9ALTE
MWIYLIRHGETNGNKDRILQTPQTPLSARGQQQASQLAASFKNTSASAILCSSHVRTQQTAAPLGSQLQCPVILSDLLQERSFGELRGRHYDDIQADFFAPDYHPPNGESHQQFAQRMSLAWQHIHDNAQRVDGNLVVMTHGLVLRFILSEIVSIPQKQLAGVRFENTCVTQINKQDLSKVPMLCDVSHLQERPLASAGVV